MDAITIMPEGLFPKFILQDKSGYAMAKAICAGIAYMYNVVFSGFESLHTVETMPAWRLDEIAWEYAIPYDYSATLEEKRDLIKRLYDYYMVMGTPVGIESYLEAYFGKTHVTEWWQYSGTAQHFKIEIGGSWDAGLLGSAVRYAQKMIDFAKNVHSVLDEITFNETKTLEKNYGTAALYAQNLEAGIDGIDMAAAEWLTDESGTMLMNELGVVLNGAEA